MAPAKSKRQSRKRRRPGQPARPGGASRAGAQAASSSRGGASRAGARAASAAAIRPRDRPAANQGDQRQRQSMLGSYGERPPSPFGGLPVSEVAIFVGALGACVGLFSGGRAALIVGVAVCALGVLEFTVREHFSGFRSHATLLAAVPPVAILAVSVAVLGAPHQRTVRELLLLAIFPVFALAFWLLRKRFRTARQARIVRPPVP